MDNSNPIPPQQEGRQADVVETKKAADVQEAKLFFLNARERLFKISQWADISEGISARFALTDRNGNFKEDFPEAGDHIKIDIPGPGSSAGEGFDWVRVEQVEDNRSATGDREWSLMKVRPSEDPATQEGIAHFFEGHATSSFLVKREGMLITAEIHGRNEKPNLESKKITDRIRNAVVGTAAASGAGKIQWEKLAKGLLSNH